jgi:replicative DNA helicase
MNHNSEILDRLPPQDQDAERRVLASILLDPAVFDSVAETVRPEDFYADANMRIFRRLKAMHDGGGRLDVALLRDALERSGEWLVIGAAYLAEVLQSAATPAHAVYYAEIVNRKAKLRAVIHAATEMLRDAWDSAADPRSVVAGAEKLLGEISTSDHAATLTDAATATVEAMEWIDAVYQNKEHAGLATGLLEFDERNGGLFPSEVIVLAARSGVGKSSLGRQIIEHNAAKGRLVYVASIEMGASEILVEMLCTKSEVNSRKIRTGTLDASDLRRLSEAATELSTQSIVFDSRPELTVADVRRTARQLHKRSLRLVVVDYLQILTPDDESASRERQVATMIQKLKALSRELKIPVLVLCQTNREAEKDKQVSLRHLREADAIGHAADVVLILECGQAGTDKEREAWLTISKNRHGPKGKLRLDWIPERTLFGCHIKPVEEYPGYRPEFAQYGGEADGF